jgi:hypothetical protein
VDDIWEAQDAVPFQIGGSGCAHLLTTRVSALARQVAPTPDDIYVLGVLTDDKAFELLKILAPTVVSQNPQASLTLVNELEGLPLAIQVAGRLLHVEASFGFSVTDLLVEIREGARLLQEQAPIDRADVGNDMIPTVAALLQRSTDRLDALTRNCFAYLAVFAPKPATFDEFAMSSVWQVDPKPVIRNLVDRGLLEPYGENRFWMHALLAAHARSLLKE